ncbi:MAG: hypothetical protein MZW92_33040 [Comamonadaceae bacterium]|nr:hypothetical protein [Comamonadaceae bacterium]
MITGGAGFLGRRLARAILARGHAHRCRGSAPRGAGSGAASTSLPPAASRDRARAHPSPATSPTRRWSPRRSRGETDSVFHLAAVVSGRGGSRLRPRHARQRRRARGALLERCRALRARRRSSCSPARSPCSAARCPTSVHRRRTPLTPQSSLRRAEG